MDTGFCFPCLCLLKSCYFSVSVFKYSAIVNIQGDNARKKTPMSPANAEGAEYSVLTAL